MTSDIVERLRLAADRVVRHCFKQPGDSGLMSIPADRERDVDLLLTEAADEIESLRSRLAECESECDAACRGHDAAHAACVDYDARLAEAIAALEQAKKDALHINKQVSTFGLAHGMVARIDAYLSREQP